MHGPFAGSRLPSLASLHLFLYRSLPLRDLLEANAPQTDGITTRGRAQLAKDMHLYHATKDSTKKDEIAARQAWLLSEHLGPRERKLRVIDVRQVFEQMKDHG
jgi:hypothetical protein